ncbi:alpha/beta fold hydrolase [Flavivirga eckloniae]|nr:alpha/beta fold hydrolase [Flavivirga eckloniae]
MKQIIIYLTCLINCSLLSSQIEQNIISEDNIIHYTTYGKGEPILIINGGPGMNSEGFKHLAKIIGKTNKAIIYDQRGTGQSKMSEINTSTITMDLMVEDIEAIRNHLKLDKWIILGHSFGGMLGSHYASKHPKRIKGLILSASGGIDMGIFSRINIEARLTKTERDSLNYWNDKISNGNTTLHAKLQRGKFLAPAYVYDKSFTPIISKRLTQLNSAVSQLVFQNMRAINFDCSKGLKDVKAPVLIIQGKEDIVDKITAETSANAFQNSKLVILEKCGHYGWLDQPKAYFENINTYLGKVKN